MSDRTQLSFVLFIGAIVSGTYAIAMRGTFSELRYWLVPALAAALLASLGGAILLLEHTDDSPEQEEE